MEKYSIEEINGNAFNVIGYTSRALKRTGHANLVEDMRKRAMSGDYDNLIAVCQSYIDIANGEVE